ncbi:MAG: hypothetical protein HKM94_05995, partial [Halobacteria archaeon]|nr:hypothetical protein [Halobacteria archaeon]
MDTFRTMLFAALVLVLFMMWQAWEKDYGQVTTPVATQTNGTSVTGAAQGDVPQAPTSSVAGMTSAPDIIASSGVRIKV